MGQMAVEACAAAAGGARLPARVDAPIALLTKDNVGPAIAAFPRPFQRYTRPLQPPRPPSPLTAAFQHRRDDDAELEQHEHRDQLEQCGHDVGAGQEQRESDDGDDRIAPVFA